jgi:hypothetical protein
MKQCGASFRSKQMEIHWSSPVAMNLHIEIITITWFLVVMVTVVGYQKLPGIFNGSYWLSAAPRDMNATYEG